MAQLSIQQNNMVVYRGDDFATQLTFTDEAGEKIDITGWKIFFTVKKAREAADNAAVISLTLDPTDPVNGIALITVSHTITYPLAGLYYYDFQFKKIDSTVQTITSGTITFELDVTRRTS